MKLSKYSKKKDQLVKNMVYPPIALWVATVATTDQPQQIKVNIRKVDDKCFYNIFFIQTNLFLIPIDKDFN